MALHLEATRLLIMSTLSLLLFNVHYHAEFVVAKYLKKNSCVINITANLFIFV